MWTTVILFLLSCFISRFNSKILQDNCVYPYIFHNFTNCEEILEPRRHLNNIQCLNEGTWRCSNFTGYDHNAEEGFIRRGDVNYNHGECCDLKNIRTLETVLMVRSDTCLLRDINNGQNDWEFEVHNIEVKGDHGDCILSDKKLNNDYLITDCYDYDMCRGNLLHIGMVFNYTDKADVCLDNIIRRTCKTCSCSMGLSLYINGELIFFSNDFVMDKFFGVEFPITNLLIGFIREMFDFSEQCVLNDELHFLRIWDIMLPSWKIKENSENWYLDSPKDGYCMEYMQDENSITSYIHSYVNGLNDSIGLLILILFLIFLATCIFVILISGCVFIMISYYK